MSEKKFVHFLKKIFKNETIMLTTLQKNTESGSFLKNSKTDIFKNVKNQKKFF